MFQWEEHKPKKKQNHNTYSGSWIKKSHLTFEVPEI